MNGIKKVNDVLESYTDWFFMQDFLTADLIDALDLYIYIRNESEEAVEYVRTGHTFEEIRQIIINSFAHSGIPKIEIVDGNHSKNGHLLLEHRFAGQPLEPEYMLRTMKHIYDLWGKTVMLVTIIGGKKKMVTFSGGDSVAVSDVLEVQTKPSAE